MCGEIKTLRSAQGKCFDERNKKRKETLEQKIQVSLVASMTKSRAKRLFSVHFLLICEVWFMAVAVCILSEQVRELFLL